MRPVALGKAAVMAITWLALTAVARPPAHSCALDTLEGHYIFEGHGFIEPVEPGVERVHYGHFDFDGKGWFSGRQTSSRGGRIGQETLAGMYTIASDCSGTLTLRHIPRPGLETYGTGMDTHWDMYLTVDGRKGNLIRTDAGTMAVRHFYR